MNAYVRVPHKYTSIYPKKYERICVFFRIMIKKLKLDLGLSAKSRAPKMCFFTILQLHNIMLLINYVSVIGLDRFLALTRKLVQAWTPAQLSKLSLKLEAAKLNC